MTIPHKNGSKAIMISFKKNTLIVPLSPFGLSVESFLVSMKQSKETSCCDTYETGFAALKKANTEAGHLKSNEAVNNISWR